MGAPLGVTISTDTPPGTKLIHGQLLEASLLRLILEEVKLTENIGLPVNPLEKHDLWPAYVTYTSPLVKRLIEKSKARDVERLQTAEESRPTCRQSKPPGVIQLRRRKSPKSSGSMTFKDVRSETTLSGWGPFSMSATGPPVVPERAHFHADARASPTTDYNKIIFSRKPRVSMLPYRSLLAGEEKHPDV
ncbi:CMT1A duplicated region transcript 4 protein [Physeter macrocephalus]|uniref:CMT1A duplicated region transcript 4 protein n=1 Tax=Physeter macrocephalus TaxID=9755 RepID=A0A2Y9FLC3_PHYMC|nr:CMT1A duplicated region transcript 4 protein [Physeter catodon]|eukprot:XP_007124764.1 CMT1A duplicated region transcript 4 protein [Physeter catodon]